MHNEKYGMILRIKYSLLPKKKGDCYHKLKTAIVV